MAKYMYFLNYFSLDETSKLTELHEATIRRLIKKNRLNPVNSTRPYRFNLNNLIACRVFYLLNKKLTWKQIDKVFTPKYYRKKDDKNDLFDFDGYDVIITDTINTVYFDLNDIDRYNLEKFNDKNFEIFISNNLTVQLAVSEGKIVFKDDAYFIYLDRIRNNIINKAKELNIDNIDEKLAS